MLNNSETTKLLTEYRLAKSDMSKLNHLTTLRELIDNEIKDIAKKIK